VPCTDANSTNVSCQLRASAGSRAELPNFAVGRRVNAALCVFYLRVTLNSVV
jgi:hypothetical protein